MLHACRSWPAAPWGASVLVFALTQFAAAQRPEYQFLFGLRERGMHAEALAYLERGPTGADRSRLFEEDLPFELLISRIDVASQIDDPVRRWEAVEPLGKQLEQMLEKNEEVPRFEGGCAKLMQLHLWRARQQLELAQDAEHAQQREAARRACREQLRRAEEFHQRADEAISNTLHLVGTVFSDDSEVISVRAQRGRDYQSVWLLEAQMLELHGRLADPDSVQRRVFLERAAEEYEGLWERYRNRIVGLECRLEQARLLVELQQTDQAVKLMAAFHDELLLVPDEEEVRPLVPKSLCILLACRRFPRDEPYSEALIRAREWLRRSRRPQRTTPDGLEVRWLLVQSLVRLQQQEANSVTRAELGTEIERHLELLAPHREAAATLLESLRE